MAYETISYEMPEEGIGLLTLNRPENYNAVNRKMMEELERFWAERLYDPDIHVIVLTGNAQSKGFCAAFINIGLGGADMACSYFLPRMIGAGRAYELMYTGEFLSIEDRNQTLLAMEKFMRTEE